MALPEHAPQIPHIPVPDLKGGLRWVGHHWPVVGSAALTLAGAGLAYQMFTGADRGPSAAPVDNAPASDTLKPPEGGPNVGIVTNPAEPTATAEAQKPATPEATKTPEIKTLQCDILSPEACATGEYIEWTRPDGEKLKGIGFVLEPGELVKLPKEGLAVSTKTIEQPYVYRGIQVIAMSKDGSETYQYYGNLDPTRLKLSELPPNAIGVIADTNLTVFEGWPYNLIYEGEDASMKKFVSITKNPPKPINNKVPGNPASNTAFFYGVTPPK